MQFHQLFNSHHRASQSLRNDRCQNILYKAVFEHFKNFKDIAALLLASKSFQNSSFGANFLVNFVVRNEPIALLESVLSPSSCFSLQFVPSLHIRQSWDDSEKVRSGISNFIGQLVSTKYLRLSLRSLTLDHLSNEILSHFFGTSSNSWSQLQHLRADSSELNDSVLELISANARQLRTVNLSENSEITDAGIEHLSKLSGITSLNLPGCHRITHAGFENIAKLDGITSLDLSYCVNISDAGLEKIAALTNITVLNLAGCDAITDAGLYHISQLCAIVVLDISWCNRITDVGVEHLCNLTCIKSLSLECCYKITDVGLEFVAKLSNITSLDLYHCHLITDAGLQLVSTLSDFRLLSLSGCRKITDAGLEYLSNLSGITCLNLGQCGKISNVGLEHISKLSKLTSLDLRDCQNITTEAKTTLRSALPNCKILD